MKNNLKHFFSLFMTICLGFTVLTVRAFADYANEAIAEGTEYKYLRSAILKMISDKSLGNTVTLLRDVDEARGLDVMIDPNVGDIEPVIDFAGHTYNVTYELAGAKGYKSQCVRIYPVTSTRPAASLTMKNGTITNGAPTGGETNYVKMLVQNWGKLTVENMVLDGSNLYPADGGNSTLSLNAGPVLVTGNNTKVIAKNGEYAFDVYNAQVLTAADIVIEGGEVKGSTLYDCSNLTGDALKLTLKITGGTFVNDDSGNGGLEVINSAGEEKIEISGGTFSYKYKDALDQYVVDGKGYYDLFPIDGREMYQIGDVYTVNFVSAYGTVPTSQTVFENTLIEEPVALTDANRIFMGWYKDPDYNEAWTFASDRVTGPITLYAKWQENVTYTVTFDANGQGTAPVAVSNVQPGTMIAEPVAPTATDYTFGGWYREAQCLNVWDFATDTVNADITLYAKWTANASQQTYEIIKGDNGVYTLSSGKTLEFTANGEFSKCTGVKVDGTTLTNEYSKKSGSTVVTLSNGYLETLSTGTHTIEILYTDGSAKGKFTVQKSNVSNGSSNQSNNTKPSTPKKAQVPNTADTLQ